MNTSWTNPKGKISLDEVCELLKLPSYDGLDEVNFDYYFQCGTSAVDDLDEDATEEEREAAREKAETEARDEVFSQWHGAVMSAAESVFEEHGLALRPRRVWGKVPQYPHEFDVRPVKGWSEAADLIRDTINGVGYFFFSTLREFIESGPFTPRKAVLDHLHGMRRRSEVYGDPSPLRVYERAFR